MTAELEQSNGERGVSMQMIGTWRCTDVETTHADWQLDIVRLDQAQKNQASAGPGLQHVFSLVRLQDGAPLPSEF